MPVGSTLLGLGGFPASHPLRLGMMGMHGEAWVNTAIQEADLLVALGHALRRPRHREAETYATKAKKIHCEIDPAEINKNVHVDLALVGDVGERCGRSCPWSRAAAARLARASRRARKERQRVRDIQAMPSIRGKLYAAHVMHELWRHHGGQGARRERRRAAPDVGGPVLQARLSAEPDHLGRPGDDGLRAPGGHRREVGAARGRGLGGRRRRRLPDDGGGAVHHRAGGHQAPRGRSSTTATSAWSGSGSSSFTGAATRPRRCASPTSSSSPTRTASSACASPSASEIADAVAAARAAHGHGRHRFPRRTGGQRLPDGPGGGRPPRHDPPAQPPSSRRADSHDHRLTDLLPHLHRLRRGPARRPQPHHVPLPPARLQHRLADGRPHRARRRPRA